MDEGENPWMGLLFAGRSRRTGAEEVGPSLKQVMEGVGEDAKGTREGEVER